MTTKAVKVSEDNYRWLSSVAGELQQIRGSPVSVDEALSSLRLGRKVSELAGSWKMSDEEAAAIDADLRKAWKRWRTESV